jgi:hypothetical protein
MSKMASRIHVLEWKMMLEMVKNFLLAKSKWGKKTWRF